MKKLIVTIGIFLFTATTCFAGQTEEVQKEFATLKSQLMDSVQSAELAECSTTLVPLYDIETLEFFSFLDETFQNKASTSSLINIAVARYIQYKSDLEQALEAMVPKGTSSVGNDQNTEYQSYVKCRQITEKYIEFSKTMMISHVKRNAYQKKSSLLLEKYQSIAEKLRKMNLSLAEMAANFEEFNNKLPGFLRQCLKK